MCSVPLLDRLCRECYSDPLDVYETLKQRGMNLVTVTDHDCIDATESLRRFPDFFLSEEVSVVLPSGNHCHIGVYGIEERHHEGLQQRRTDLPALAAYLSEQQLLFSINHVFSSLTGRRSLADFACLYHHVPAVEVRNGAMLAACNDAASAWAAQSDKIGVGGSDAHTLAPLGRTYTEVPQARNAREFLDYLRAGQGRVDGLHSNFRTLTATVTGIGLDMMYDNVWTSALAPLFAAVPLVTGVQCVAEFLFARTWRARALNMLPFPELAQRTS